MIETKQDLKSAILSNLSDRPLSEKVLSKRLGVNDRIIREAVRELITEGHPVLSSSSKGLWIANTPEELIECAEKLKHIGIEYILRRRDLMRCAKKMQGQLRLV